MSAGLIGSRLHSVYQHMPDHTAQLSAEDQVAHFSVLGAVKVLRSALVCLHAWRCTVSSPSKGDTHDSTGNSPSSVSQA